MAQHKLHFLQCSKPVESHRTQSQVVQLHSVLRKLAPCFLCQVRVRHGVNPLSVLGLDITQVDWVGPNLRAEWKVIMLLGNMHWVHTDVNSKPVHCSVGRLYTITGIGTVGRLSTNIDTVGRLFTNIGTVGRLFTVTGIAVVTIWHEGFHIPDWQVQQTMLYDQRLLMILIHVKIGPGGSSGDIAVDSSHPDSTEEM